MGISPGEQPLLGGNVSQGVVRVGNTVRRSAGPWSPAVHELLVHLNAVGFEGAPRSYGFDEHGRHVLEYVEGDVPQVFPPADQHSAMRRIGVMMRDFHDASAGFVPPAEVRWNVVIPADRADLVVHHDLAPWNLVCGTRRWVFIDWDTAAPGSRLWDLAYAAHAFAPLAHSIPVETAASRISELAEAYGLDEVGRRDLVDLLHRRIMGMYELLRDGHRDGVQPWSRLWSEGHGDLWLADADYVRQHIEVIRAIVVSGT